jgi:hypothetical protein
MIMCSCANDKCVNENLKQTILVFALFYPCDPYNLNS